MGPRCRNELLKQALRERIIRHALRMPLNSYDPIGVTSPFHAFDGAIRCVGSDTELFTGLVNSLVMATVDVRGGRPCQLRENASHSQYGIMSLVATFSSCGEICSPVRNGVPTVWPNIGDVLNQGAFEMDVENLAAVANGQHRLRRPECVRENRFVGRVSIGVQSLCLGVFRRAIAAGVHIRWAARQNKSVQFFELAGKLFRRLFERYFPWVGTGFPDCLKVEIEFVARTRTLLLGGAPRDAHTGAG